MLRSLLTRSWLLSEHIHFTGLRQQFDFDSFPHLLPGQFTQFVSQLTQASLGRAHQVEHGRIAGSHLLQCFFRRDAPIHHPDPLRLAILLFDLLQKVFERGLVAGVAGHHFVGQRKTFRRDNQPDDYLHAVRPLVSAVTEFSSVLFGKRRVAFAVRAGQVVEQHVELCVEQIFPALCEVIEQLPFVLQNQIVAIVELVTLGQLAKVRAQQIAHRAVLEPLPVQAPFTARIDQAVNAEGLEHQVPTRAFAAGRQALGPKFIEAKFFIQMAGQPAGAPLAWVTQLQFAQLDSHDVGTIDFHATLFGKQRHRAGHCLAVLKNFDGLLPGRLLLIVDLAQVENMALDDSVAHAAFVLDDRPGPMLLAIFLSCAATQKHNGN